jgi:DNA-binding beta-propeller fold protein YncE
MAFHPTGEYLAILCAGFRDHEVVLIDLNPQRPRVVSRATIDQAFYGLTFSPDGSKIYASGGEFERVEVFQFDRGYIRKEQSLSVTSGRPQATTVVGGIAFDATGRDLLVASPWADAVIRVPLVNPENRRVILLKPEQVRKAAGAGEPPSPPDGRKEPLPAAAANSDDPGKYTPTIFPYTCLAHPDGRRAFVSLWAKAAIAVIDLDTNQLAAIWKTAEHPTEMVLSPQGDILYVACSNSTKVSVIETSTGKGLQTIHCALYPTAGVGNTPNSLALTPDGQVLFVANADNNNLAVFNVADPKLAKPMGFIPTGWYPTSVRYSAKDRTIYVANGKGMSSKANRSGPNPLLPRAKNLGEYIGMLFTGTLSIIPMPKPDQMATYTKQAYACSPLRDRNEVRADKVEPNNPIPRQVGDPSPIKYVIYVIKENRTYDQVLGDLGKGNGEPELCLFPEPVTPNHHKLAREFVLIDNLYVDGEVSADGHEWSMGAYATDFVEKIWPLSYRGGKVYGYPAEGNYDQAARPSGGYLWNKCIEARVSYRAYGEWVNNGKMRPDGTFEDGTPAAPELAGLFDPQFRGYDLDYPDVKRAERFISELKRFEAQGVMPRLQVVRLPNDHTAGSRAGKPTVTAMVADNDLALGLLVEAVSHSKFWKETAIFVIEDDTQNGPDHVDAHRSPAFVISPYAKRKAIDSTLYSTSSMLRTMELILGLKPMSQFDAAARPMYNCFTSQPDFTPYKHEVPKVDLNERNPPGMFGAAWLEKQNLAKEDAVDDILFSEIIWKAVRGRDSEMPPPVRAAFFVPVKAAKHDQDDD